MASITLRKSVQQFEGGLYVKNVQQNFALRSLGAGTDNFFATTFDQVSNTLVSTGTGTARINRTFVIS
jgi:hypothetical protein